jgi:hypothetical protein
MGLMRDLRGTDGDLETRNVLGRHWFGRGWGRRFRNRDRGADLFFRICESLFEKRANIGGGAGFLKPWLNVGEGLGRESFHGEQNALREVRWHVKTVSGEEIGVDIFGTREILDLKVALGKNLPPTPKATIVRFEEVSREHKLGEVAVVGENLHGRSGLGEVMAVLVEGVDNGEELLVVDVPTLFSLSELVMKDEKGEPTIFIFLFHDAGVGRIWGVGGKASPLSWDKGADKDITADGCEEGVKGLLTYGGPIPGDILFEQVSEAGGGVGIMRDELVIETEDAEKRAEVGNTSRWLKVTYSLDLILRHSDSLAADDGEAEEITFFAEPFALLGFETETILVEGFENFEDLGFVFFQASLGVDDDIIEVSVAEDSEIGVENRVDKALEDGGGGWESHWHDGVLKESIEGFEGGQMFRARGDTDIGEAGADVHGSDPVGACEVVHNRAGEGNRILVLFNVFVEVAEINDEAELPGACAWWWVSYEEDRGGGLGFGRTDKAALEF